MAALFMLVDHAAVAFGGALIEVPGGSLLITLMRCIGRLSFPIFIFLMAEGCRKTKHFPNYLLRLGIFAAISELPFRLLFPGVGSSVILTFLLGALAIYGFQRLSEQDAHQALVPLPLLLACLGAILLRTDYGFPAILLLFALYLCGEDQKRQLRCLSVGLALIYLIYNPLIGLLSTLPVLWGSFVVPYLVAVMPMYALQFLCTIIAVLLLTQYRGLRGKGSKWFFYLFYPAHIMVLFLVSMLINEVLL